MRRCSADGWAASRRTCSCTSVVVQRSSWLAGRKPGEHLDDHLRQAAAPDDRVREVGAAGRHGAEVVLVLGRAAGRRARPAPARPAPPKSVRRRHAVARAGPVSTGGRQSGTGACRSATALIGSPPAARAGWCPAAAGRGRSRWRCGWRAYQRGHSAATRASLARGPSARATIAHRESPRCTTTPGVDRAAWGGAGEQAPGRRRARGRRRPRAPTPPRAGARRPRSMRRAARARRRRSRTTTQRAASGSDRSQCRCGGSSADAERQQRRERRAQQPGRHPHMRPAAVVVDPPESDGGECQRSAEAAPPEQGSRGQLSRREQQARAARARPPARGRRRTATPLRGQRSPPAPPASSHRELPSAPDSVCTITSPNLRLPPFVDVETFSRRTCRRQCASVQICGKPTKPSGAVPPRGR